MKCNKTWSLLVLTMISLALGLVKAETLQADLVWVEHSGDEHQIKFSALVDNEWKAPSTIYSSEHHITTPAINTMSGGSKLLLWSEKADKETVLMSMRKPVSASDWQEARRFNRFTAENLSPSIVIDSANRAWVFWSSNHQGLDDIYMSRQIPTGWTQAERVNTPNKVPDIQPQAELNLFGDVTVNWLTYDHTTGQYLTIERVFELEDVDKRRYKPVPEDVDERKRFDELEMPDFLPRNTAAVLHLPQNQNKQSVRLDLVR